MIPNLGNLTWGECTLTRPKEVLEGMQRIIFTLELRPVRADIHKSITGNDASGKPLTSGISLVDPKTLA